jgi:hypothetical protein
LASLDCVFINTNTGLSKEWYYWASPIYPPLRN